MANQELNDITKQVIKDLQDDINELLLCESNIEVIWKLQKLHCQDALFKSAELIRKSLLTQ
jgi:hypothetical protein